MPSTVGPIGRLVDGYLWTWTLVDHRVDDWWLMSSIKPVLFILVVYFCLVIYGPQWMQGRQPFNMKWIQVFYNVSIAMLNLHVFLEVSTLTYQLRYSWTCQMRRVTTDPDEMRILSALHWYFISKVFEFFDTVIMVCRKKDNQLTPLHIYHHSTIFFFSWIALRWEPGGMACFAAILNSFVHVIMYSYYAISSFGPSMAKYLWWKRYITILQLVQFAIGIAIGVNLLIIDCPYPKWMLYMNLYYNSAYLFLFGRFYVRSYLVDPVTKKLKQLNKFENGALKGKSEKDRELNGSRYHGVVSTSMKAAID